MRSLDVAGQAVEVVTTGRHDPCVGIRATPICEAMVALVLMDQALRHRAQCGDVGEITPRIPGKPAPKNRLPRNDSGRLRRSRESGPGGVRCNRAALPFCPDSQFRDRLAAQSITSRAGRTITGPKNQ